MRILCYRIIPLRKLRDRLRKRLSEQKLPRRHRTGNRPRIRSLHIHECTFSLLEHLRIARFHLLILLKLLITHIISEILTINRFRPIPITNEIFSRSTLLHNRPHSIESGILGIGFLDFPHLSPCATGDFVGCYSADDGVGGAYCGDYTCH